MDASEAFILGQFWFTCKNAVAFQYSGAILEDTEDIALVNPGLCVRAESSGSPDTSEHSKGLVCFADTCIDLNITVAAENNFAAQVDEFLHIFSWFSMYSDWVVGLGVFP